LEYNEKNIKKALKYLAIAIKNRKDGEIYLPLFERLESELESLQAKTEVINRVNKWANTN
tara:strand:+ start:890 stop:1069 length:180 start_codon:yes stop_codon:yes gene_type:complete